MRRKIALCLSIFCVTGVLLAENRINVYWTDTPPVIDARDNDVCWKTADRAKNFTLFKKAGQPTQPTEVAVCYDADCLYLFWKLYDKNPEKIVFGNPEDVRDFITWKDVAELFLDPGQTKEHYYQFAASPSAARFDLSSRKSTNFNPDWKVKGAICEWGWALEMAIPFTELAHQNEFFGTPAVGDVWGINFCRDQGSLHEWSQWEVSMMSFHEVKNFGTAVFCGRKEGEKLPTITAVEFEPLFYGPGTLSFQVKSTRPYLGCDFFLSQDGQSVVRRTGEKVAPGQLQLPYQISRPGTWRLAVSFYEGKNKVYSGATFCQLPPVAENLLEIRKKMDQARMKLKTFQHAYRPLLEKQLNRLEENLAQAIQQVQQPSSLSRQDWQKLTSVVLAAGSDWKKLDFDLGLVGLYPEKKTASFGLVPVPATAKIYPDSILTRPAGPVKLALAGNEYESFQMVLVPFWKEVPDIQVSFSDLSGPKKISRKNFSSFRVEYVRLKNVDPEDTHLREYEPDILFPAEKFSLQPGKLQPVWIDFYLPPNTPAGTYRGRVTFTTGKESRSWPVEVTSYGFNLPRKSSIENQFWFSLYRWKNFYGTLDYTPELYAKHAAVLSRYRISCLPSDWIIMWDKIRVYYEEDGRFTFDFSELDKFIKIGLEAGSNTYWASLGCNLGSLTPFSRPWTKVIDRKTGKETTLDRVMKDWLDKFREGKTYWDENPMYRDYLQAYVAHLKELGLLETAYWEIYDEPNDNSRWLDMLRHHRWLRQFVPELKLFNFGVEPTQVKAGQNALGLIDCWAPHIDGLDEPEILAAMKERRQKYGEKYWFYTCGERVNKEGEYAPFITYYRPYLTVRIHPWIAWKYETDGFFIFALSSVPDDNVKKNPEERWPKTEWSDGAYRGCGTLVYPGPEYQVIPGMRLAHLRDGLEDYEYFAILRNRLKSGAGTKQWQSAAKKALKIEPEIVRDIYHWTKDVSLLEAKRASLASLIQTSLRPQKKSGAQK